jgi:O-antigen/teichoic acid export membrane protein
VADGAPVVVVAGVVVAELVGVVVAGCVSHGGGVWVSGAGGEAASAPAGWSSNAAAAIAATRLESHIRPNCRQAPGHVRYRHCPMPTPRTRYREAISNLQGSDTAKAAGLAGAMIANNVIALGSSVVFARWLGDYGSLATLISYLLILTVFGQAMQVATAREGVLGHLGRGPDLLATLERWARSLAIALLALTAVSILARHPIADLLGVRHQAWAAAAGLPAGVMYLEVSILRGALQGIGDYRSVGISLVGEQGSRLIAGAVLVAVGLGVGGAYLGSLISYIAMSTYCAVRLYANLGGGVRLRAAGRTAATAALGLWRHIGLAWVPIAGLAVIQLLQNMDLIIARHQFSTRVDSAYAATAVAAKVLIWVAMGAGFYLVPETSRRRAQGEDTRAVLFRALGIVLVCSIPCLLIYALAAHPLLAIVFKKPKAIASSSLLPLGAAFTVLAATYLAVQYMLALKRTAFLVVIGVVAVIEPVVLLQAPKHPAPFAAVVLGIQALGALLAYAMALRSGGSAPVTAPSDSTPGAESTLDPEPATVS